MAIRVQMETPSILKVEEVLPGYMCTEYMVVRYDFALNRKKVNDENWREMSQSSKDWAIKYYLPKLKENVRV